MELCKFLKTCLDRWGDLGKNGATRSECVRIIINLSRDSSRTCDLDPRPSEGSALVTLNVSLPPRPIKSALFGI